MDVVSYAIVESELRVIERYARAAELGGRSHVRKPDERCASLRTDQLVGQLCTFAGTMYLTGKCEMYALARDRANANPYVGDGGTDIPGYRIDIKGSLMRRSPDPMTYRLLVRPRERHADTTYILALASSVVMPITVHLVGWLSDEEIERPPEWTGIFSGAHVVPASQLHPMSSLRLIQKTG